MAVVSASGVERVEREKMGHIRRKRRAQIRIDMTPMVDIAFLLLIFYMVSTMFGQPQAMEVNLPPTENTVRVKQSLLLTLRIDADESLWWHIGDGAPQSVPFDSLRPLLLERNLAEPQLTTLVKIHQDARYFRMVDVLDEIKLVEKQIKSRDPDFSYRFCLAPSYGEEEE
jgi:biopolymer transport protein ExbD